jgi:hypothetical protein
MCKYEHKHVFLVGTCGFAQMREFLTARLVTVDVFDNDEYVNDDIADEAVFSSG